MRRQRQAKIIATLGPGSSNPEMLRRLLEAGVDVFRLNFSHGTHAEHGERLQMIRDLEQETKRPIGILGDLQGPKLRVGEFRQRSIRLIEGARFQFDLSDERGDETRVQLPHPEIFAAVEVGQTLLMDDGKVRVKVLEKSKDVMVTEVMVGGPLSDHKGVNVPEAQLPLSAITEKDRADLAYALEIGVDWIALSFVQRPEDVRELRELVRGRAGVLAKLEKPSAVQPDALMEIITESDAVMVARGDLGVEIPSEEVPAIQKRIIRTARRLGTPVVVATQMLDSMVKSPIPTRAESSDVATAVYDGADAVMLSAETAVGDYPVEAVSVMNRIIRTVEMDDYYERVTDADRCSPDATIADAVTNSARHAARTISASAIVTFTSTGSTSLRAARVRPNVQILGLTPRSSTARRLALVWGIHPVKIRDIHNVSEMVDKAIKISKREGFAGKGDRLVVTAGVPFGIPGATNNMRIIIVP
ncbi:MAG: pyruvate kinase [Magnetospiraceae bacterium]